MSDESWIVFGGSVAFALSAGLTVLVRAYALRTKLLDEPNARSSHSRPTARGGGLAIVAASFLTVTVLWFSGMIASRLFTALIIGGSMIALVGYLDDRRGVPARIRLIVHFAAALTGLWVLGGVQQISFGSTVLELGSWGTLLAAIAVVWATNLFNFMDGIDGIAASEASLVLTAGGFLGLLGGWTTDVSLVSFAVAAASLGFLVWNWPPATIFMGDVGSGFLGYVAAILAVAAGIERPVALTVWIILGSAFLVDATVTLGRRLARGERVFEAHRSHAYQWLARRWGSHRRVTLTFVAIGAVWLFPCALLATLNPAFANWILLTTLALLAPIAVIAGSGRSEERMVDRAE